MTYTASYGLGPHTTPKIIRYLVIATCTVSLLCAFVNIFFVSFLQIRGPQALLSLSWDGISRGFLWQPISYLLVQANGENGISASFFLELFFNMYILWVMGSSIAERCGGFSFLNFYMSAGAVCGMMTLAAMPMLGQYTVLAGPTGALLALLTVWGMIYPESELQLFFLILIKGKWLIAGIFLAFLLANLSHLNFIYVFFCLFSILFGYLYGTLIWQLDTPFHAMHKFDHALISLGLKIRKFFSSKKGTDFADDKRKKIIDFHTGKTLLDDDHFMDSALEKISKFGEQALTWNERNRMKKISERKSRQKNKE